MIDLLIEQLADYLPEAQIHHYSLFDPKKWPEDRNLLYYHPAKHLPMMVRLFGHEDESTDEYATEWREMVSQMRRNREEFEKYRESDTIHFWYHFLKKGTVPEKIADMVLQVLSYQ